MPAVTQDTPLAALYDEIRQWGYAAIASGRETPDPLLGTPDDQRFGITLTLRPAGEAGRAVVRRIQHFLDRLRAIEPEQYYYPPDTFHVSAFCFVAARQGYQPTPAQAAACAEIAARALEGLSPIRLDLRGVAASEGAVLVCDYEDGTLTRLRETLRAAMRKGPLPLDERFHARTFHLTCARFVRPLIRRDALLALLRESEQEPFGQLIPNDLQLVCHDWYDRRKTLLARIPLQGN
jgi:2'-5' RNA ligase